MEYPDTIPMFIISYAYEMIAEHGSVARTISVCVSSGDSELAITGGSPDITPYHSYDKRYVSLQEFINGVAHRRNCN